MAPWRLTDQEWETLNELLMADIPAARGRPRVGEPRSIAEACLYRSYHSLSRGRSHCFDWNRLPPEFGVSPSTANRRFREWNESGAWLRFWDGLNKFRRAGKRVRPRRSRKLTPYPASDLASELQRAYHFFNQSLFGAILPEHVAITVIRGTGPGRHLGYFCGRAWYWGTETAVDHIAISGQAIGRGPHAALETLIHEMTHHRNDRLNLVDCTSRGLYHNRHFRDSAILAGLECRPRHVTYGYGITMLGEHARRAIVRFRPKESLFRAASPQVVTEPEGQARED